MNRWYPVCLDDDFTLPALLVVAAADDVSAIRIANIGTSSSTSSTNSPNANAEAAIVIVKVTTAYSAGATIQVGQGSSISSLMGPGDNNPQVVSTYANIVDAVLTNVPIVATVGGSPGAGAATVMVFYTNTVLS